MDTYINLDRQYRKYNAQNENEFLWLYKNKEQSLDSVIATYTITVILGDKGAGKTTEILQYSHKLKGKGKKVFFFKLDDLATSNMDRYKKLRIEYNASKNKEECLFFLDSIDECRISNNKQDYFVKALENLVSYFKVTNNCKFVITCRENCWKSVEDIETIKHFLILSKKEKIVLQGDITTLQQVNNDDIEQIFVCNILPLSPFHVKKIADKCNMYNYHSFQQSITNNLIPEDFYNTPIECIDTINHYKRYGSLPNNFNDFLYHKLFFRYRELNQNYKNELKLEKIEQLSKRLAISTLLCGKTSILKTENYSTYNSYTDSLENSLSLRNLFIDEDEDVIEKYINSTIFSSNGYNHVKFYNENIKNYVAYLWLKERIDKNRYNDIKNILFFEREGNVYPRKRLIIPIILLAEKEYEFRKILMDNTPELLIKYSQYCSLSDIDKIDILLNIVNNRSHQASSLWGYSSDNEISLYYFYSDALIPHIVNLYNSVNNDMKIFFLSLLKYVPTDKLNQKINKLIWKEFYNSCNYAIKNKSLDNLLMHDDITIIQKLKEYIKKNYKRCAASEFYKILSTIYAQDTDLFHIFSLYISRNDDTKNNEICRDMLFITYFTDRLSIKDSLYLYNLTVKIEKLHNTIKHNNYIHMYIWSSCIISLLKKDYKKNIQLANILVAFQIALNNFQHHGNNSERELNENIQIIKELVNEKIKKIYFTIYFNKRGFSTKTLREVIYTNSRIIIPFNIDNIINLLKFYLIIDNDEKINILKLLTSLFDSYDEFNNIITKFILTEEERQVFYNFKIERDLKKKKYNVLEQNYYDNNHSNDLIRKKEFLSKNLQKLSSGDRELTGYFLDLTYNYSIQNDYSEIDAVKFKQDYGDNIFRAYIQGVKKYWRFHDANNYQEYLDTIGTSKILNSSIIASVGIPLYLKDNPQKINATIAKKMIYFGCQSLNNFPFWFSDIIKKYPNEAKRIILPIIKKVFASQNSDFTFINKLFVLDVDILNIFYKDLCKAINDNEIKHLTVLKSTLELLCKIPLVDKQYIVNIVISKINMKDAENSVPLLRLLFIIDFCKFKDVIQNMEKILDIRNMSNIVSKIFAQLHEYWFYIKNCQISDNLEFLADLIPLLFKYISPRDDTNHTPGIIYSPSDRDRAQDFRREIVYLAERTKYNKNDRKLLLQISENIDIQYYKDYFHRIADDMLIDDSNFTILKENDIINIENGDYITPNSAEDLFKIVCNKLYDIKSDIELSDYSIKELYHHLRNDKNEKNYKKIKHEKYFQLYILKELRFLARNLYSTVREPEVNNCNKPDLQVWEKSWCINIECKIADSWTLNQLISALTDQLVGKYLKHQNNRYGILLLADMQGNKTWDGMNFDNLIFCLQKKADCICEKSNNIQNIKVIGIKYY